MNTLFIRASKKLSRKGIYTFLEDQYRLLPAGTNILLIGSGGPIAEQLYNFAQKSKFKVSSIDIDKKRKPDIIGDVCAYDFGSKQFDVVVLSEALEHFHNPKDAISNIFNHIKDGGKVIITVPYIFPIHDRPHDYYRFTKYGLSLLFKEFSSVTIKERNNWGEAIAVLMIRHFNENQKGKYLISGIGFVLYPVLYLLGSIFKTDFFTTGYNVVAVK